MRPPPRSKAELCFSRRLFRTVARGIAASKHACAAGQGSLFTRLAGPFFHFSKFKTQNTMPCCVALLLGLSVYCAVGRPRVSNQSRSDNESRETFVYGRFDEPIVEYRETGEVTARASDAGEEVHQSRDVLESPDDGMARGHSHTRSGTQDAVIRSDYPGGGDVRIEAIDTDADPDSEAFDKHAMRYTGMHMEYAAPRARAPAVTAGRAQPRDLGDNIEARFES